MKKYILGFALLAGFVLTSCDTKNEGALYSSSFQNVSFEIKEANQILTQDATLSIPVRLIRANTADAYTAHYTLISANDGIFTDANGGQVTFESGKAEAVVVINAANMVKGNEYTAKLKLSDADVAQADTTTNTAIAETTISIMCDYNWVNAGTCTFIDFNFADDEEKGAKAENVSILNGEGSNVYRIVSPLYKVYKSNSFETSAPNIDFYLNADGTITFPEGSSCNMAGYYLYWDTKNYSSYCFVEQNGNDYTVNHMLRQGTSLYLGKFQFIWKK
jgi:hypothetical protein